MTAGTFDVSAVVSTIESIPMAEVGLAIVGVAAIAMGFKWIKGAMFG